jgi:hypothetical protein
MMLSPSSWIPTLFSRDLCLASFLETLTPRSELNRKHLGDLLRPVTFITLRLALEIPKLCINQHYIPLSNLLVVAVIF